MRDFISHIDLIFYQVYANLRSEARRYYMSFIWWIINPVLDMVIYYIVFGILFQRGFDGFVPFLLIGIVAWRWMATALLRSVNSIRANTSLINRVHVPKIIIPTIIIFTETFKFLIAFAILLLFLFLYRLPTIHYIALMYILFAELIFITGVTYLFTAITPFFPDLQVLLENGLRLIFFLSGIFYKIGFIPAQYQFWFKLNPMVNIIESFRTVLLDNQWPNLSWLAYVTLLSIVLIFIGNGILKKFERIYPRIVLS